MCSGLSWMRREKKKPKVEEAHHAGGKYEQFRLEQREAGINAVAI